MKCFVCGNESERMICEECYSDGEFESQFIRLMQYDEKHSDDQLLSDFFNGFDTVGDAYKKVEEMITPMDEEMAEYYRIRYYGKIKDARFEEMALSYLDSRDKFDRKKQQVLWYLLNSYLHFDYVKPAKWCELIRSTPDLCHDLYFQAAKHHAMVGDYEIAEELIEIAIEKCIDANGIVFLPDATIMSLEDLEKYKKTIARYQSGNPFWPNTEERRAWIASIYKQKGVKCNKRITFKPTKVNEGDFTQFNEEDEYVHQDYCAFWCKEAKVKKKYKAPRGICEISAIKVRGGIAVDEFKSYVRPGYGGGSKKDAILNLDLGLDYLENASPEEVDVDHVIKRFMDFVGSDVLISTDALGYQAKLLSRAMRYAGMNGVENGFVDLLDYAELVSDEFDMENNSREYLVKYFNLEDTDSTIGKTHLNVEIYRKLMEMDT